MAKVSDVA